MKQQNNSNLLPWFLLAVPAQRAGTALASGYREGMTADHSRRVLNGLTAQDTATAPAQGAGAAGRGNTQPAAKTAQTAQEDGRKGNGLAERGREGDYTFPRPR